MLPSILLAAAVATAAAASGAPATGAADSDRAAPPPSEATTSAADLLPLAWRSRTFVVAAGPGAGQRLPLTLEPRADDGGRRWLMQLGELNTLYLLEQPDGSIDIERIDLSEERETVYYDPPVTLLPGHIVPDRSWQGRGRARILDWDMGAIEHRGSYRHQVLPVSQARLHTPAGDFDGYRIEIRHTVDLQAPAEVRLHLEAGLVPGEGLVKRSLKVTIDKPAWFGRSWSRIVQLASEP
jgi:hypothetical protein